MNNIIVFSEQSLYYYLSHFEIRTIKEEDRSLEKCIQIVINGVIYYFSLSQKDKNIDHETLIIFKDIDKILVHPENLLQELFSRIHKYAHEINKKNNKLIPRSWSPFHFKNKICFFAFDNIKNNASKVVIDIRESMPNNLLVHGLVQERNFELANYLYSDKEYTDALLHLPEAINKFKEKYEERKIDEMGNNLYLDNPVVNEDKYFSYDEWMKKLSKVQEKFVNSTDNNAIKLRGPAGTGKTLAMELKAVRVLRSNNTAKILFLTHSWTVADHVQDFIEQLVQNNDELKRIDIFPLLSFAEMFVPNNNRDLIVLGDDSFSGKMEQLKLIESIVKEYKLSNFALYKNRFSDFFLQKVNTDDINLEKLFYWDLMIEFACVIGANGIMPGITAKEKYLKIERRPWMMTLHNNADKEFVINIYQEYINNLIKNKRITSDQIINDYLNYLSTYNWHYERIEKGYDYIFVDEMQLFNEQERMILHHLTKSPDVYPMLFMALDPRQTITEIYFDYGIKDAININENELSESTFGNYKQLILGEVFRYTKEILDFLIHIDKSFPALGLGSDWENNIKKTVSKKGNGKIPEIAILTSMDEELIFVYDKADQYISEGLKVAILALDNNSYIALKSRPSSESYICVESKEDTIKLQYKKKGIVISQPYYVIGLQFDAVILIGCYIHFNEHDKYQMYNLRRFISDVYLGASRASKRLLITSNIHGSMPTFIENAVQKKYLLKIY
jgi:superfamily I DNA/RNA helicase